MGRIKKWTVLFFLLVCLFSPGVSQSANDPYFGLDETADIAGLSNSRGDVPTLVGNIIGAVLTLISVIFFTLMVYGGFLWMTAHGDSAQVDKGRETIIAGVIGIIVVLASYGLTIFVFRAVGGGGGAPSGVPGSGGDRVGGNEPFQPGEVRRGQNGENLGVEPIIPRVAPAPAIP